MAVIVAEFQFYRGDGNVLILKEAALTDVLSNYECYMLAKPPCNLNTFTSKTQQSIEYVYAHIHGIPWYAGTMDLNHMEKIIKKVVSEAHIVYVKGLEKVKFLLGLTGCESEKIVNMDEYPNISKTSQRRPYFCCPFYHPYHNKMRCALEQSTRYRDYLRENYYFNY